MLCNRFFQSCKKYKSAAPNVCFQAFKQYSTTRRTTQSVNPATDEVVGTYDLWTNEEAKEAVVNSEIEFKKWKRSSFAERSALFNNAAALLRTRKDQLSQLMALEMGKPLAEGRAEVEKCANICEYYAKNAEAFLSPEEILPATAGSLLPGRKNMITFNPLGPVFIIMPWNFPLWQVFRQAATALSAGNTMLLKHASNVFGCAWAIEQVLIDAGFPKHVFQNIPISGSQASHVIQHPFVRAVAVTGSTPVGVKVGAAAGEQIKPHVLELGGSDAYVILEDANIDAAVEACVGGRILNCGQSCIGAKRFIPVASVHDEFLEKFTDRMSKIVVGNPLTSGVQMGPMVDKEARTEIHEQVLSSVEKGAVINTGGVVPTGTIGAFYPPTVLSNISKGMPAYGEEFFGPVASVICAANEEEAIFIANDTEFGLGAGVFTQDIERGERIATHELEAGLCFVNDTVKSHQALPFGGIKTSGVGRECGEYGIKEFVNIKSVVVK